MADRTRIWDRAGDEELPPMIEMKVRELLGALLITGAEELKQILCDEDDDIGVIGNVAFSFQRYPGDETPFLAIGSYPDDERIAYAFVKKINDLMEGHGIGTE
jgi:hypothetical protein